MDEILLIKLRVYETHDEGKLSDSEKNILLDIINNIDEYTGSTLIESGTDNSPEYNALYQETVNVIETLLNRKVTKNFAVMNFGVYGNGATDRGFGNDPYFKIFDGDNPNRSKNVTRISFLRPEYIIHKNQVWNLDNTEKKTLMKYLSQPYKDSKSLWDRLIDEAIDELDSIKFAKEYPTWINTLKNARNNMPDYTKLIPVK